jgi:hypothetical protein
MACPLTAAVPLNARNAGLPIWGPCTTLAAASPKPAALNSRANTLLISVSTCAGCAGIVVTRGWKPAPTRKATSMHDDDGPLSPDGLDDLELILWAGRIREQAAQAPSEELCVRHGMFQDEILKRTREMWS